MTICSYLKKTISQSPGTFSSKTVEHYYYRSTNNLPTGNIYHNLGSLQFYNTGIDNYSFNKIINIPDALMNGNYYKRNTVTYFRCSFINYAGTKLRYKLPIITQYFEYKAKVYGNEISNNITFFQTPQFVVVPEESLNRFEGIIPNFYDRYIQPPRHDFGRDYYFANLRTSYYPPLYNWIYLDLEKYTRYYIYYNFFVPSFDYEPEHYIYIGNPILEPTNLQFEAEIIF